jgi:hypothetical protein
MGEQNGLRRPIQFWVAVVGIGGLAFAVILLIMSVTALAVWGTEGRAQSDTLNNGLLLSLGGLVGLSGTVGAYLFSRGAQGEPLTSPPAVESPRPGQSFTTTVHSEAEVNPRTEGEPS